MENRQITKNRRRNFAENANNSTDEYFMRLRDTIAWARRRFPPPQKLQKPKINNWKQMQND